MHSPIGPPSQRMDPSFNSAIPGRANLQRRFSQPVNSMSMGRFHPYGMPGSQGNRFSSNFTSRNPSITELPDGFDLKEAAEASINQRTPGAQSNEQGLGNTSDLGEHSLASLNLESSFGSQAFMPSFTGRSSMNMDQDFMSNMNPMMTGSNFRQGANPRRHSLADPYSLQRFQAMRLGMNPMAVGNTPGESPPGFDFNSAQSGLNGLSSNTPYTIKEEDEFPLVNSQNNANMMNNNLQQSFANGNMRNNEPQSSNNSGAFMNSQRNFNQLQAAGMFNGMQFNMQTSSGEENQITPTYST